MDRAAQFGGDALALQLQLLWPGLKVEIAASLPSTNTALMDRIRAGDATPTLLVARQQTQGRGRLGRPWLSREGASLTFSLALPLAPAGWSGLSLAVGLTLAQALDEGQPPRLLLKWPNDLWLVDGGGSGRKLGGILIETVSAGAQRIAVIGIGINVLPQAVAGATDGLAHGLACVQELHADIDAAAVLQRVAAPLLQQLRHFETNGFAPLLAAYARRDLLRGRSVTTTQPGVPAGVAEGVDADGALCVLHQGRVHRVVSGEVSVRLDAREPH